MKGHVVLCGGTGFLGTALKKRLEDQNYEVLTVSRRPNAGEYGWDQLPQILEGARAVVNLSGRSIACKFSEQNKKEILDSRIDSTQKVALAIQQCLDKPIKWINAAATGIYGDRGDEVLTEASANGTGFVADVCIKWEAACLESEVKIPKTVVRIGVVLSAHGGILEKLIPLTKAFLGGQAGDGKQWLSWIALDDIVSILQWTIENDTPEVVLACSPNPVQNKDFAAWLRKVCGRLWSPPIPAFMIRLVGKLVGPDASLVLDSQRAVPKNLGSFEFRFPELSDLKREHL